MSNKQREKQWITFKVSASEMKAIEAYCEENKRTKTDVLRELIRQLPTFTNLNTHSQNNK